jgi:hypothetical protein
MFDNRVRLGWANMSLWFAASTFSLAAQVSVLTSHNDNARTGLNPNETILTRTNVNMYGFGRLFSQPVDEQVYAQPLYVPNVTITNKGVHNVVFVATQNDSVYAFDADSNQGSNSAPLWHASFLNPAAGITAPTAADAAYPSGDCLTFVGHVGIVGTPVIDSVGGTLYVVARTKEPLPPPNSSSYVQVQRLHALDISSGNERPNSPVQIQAVMPGTGDGSSGGNVAFDPAREVQRSALLLANGVVYVAWASYCDINPYHGWILAYEAQTLQQVGAFNATPNGGEGGIWMSGGGIAAAPDGSLYCITGNGTFDTSVNPQDFGDSFLKLNPSPSLSLADYFAPSNQASLAAGDLDLGSGGAVVLPDSVGTTTHPHLLVGAGKEGKVYLLDRDNLGHFNATQDQVLQEVLLGPTSGEIVFGMPAFFNNHLYFQGVGLPVESFSISNGLLSTSAVSQSQDREVGFRGATPSVSANGTSNGIVWEVVATTVYGVSSLHAYNSDDLSQKLYDSLASLQAGAPDRITFVKFVVPTIADGKVFVGTSNSVAVFGLRTLIWSVNHDASAGTIHLVFSGPAGLPNTLQASGDLVNWTDLGPGTPTGTGTFSYTETIALGTRARFYRVVN